MSASSVICTYPHSFMLINVCMQSSMDGRGQNPAGGTLAVAAGVHASHRLLLLCRLVLLQDDHVLQDGGQRLPWGGGATQLSRMFALKHTATSANPPRGIDLLTGRENSLTPADL